MKKLIILLIFFSSICHSKSWFFDIKGNFQTRLIIEPSTNKETLFWLCQLASCKKLGSKPYSFFELNEKLNQANEMQILLPDDKDSSGLHSKVLQIITDASTNAEIILNSSSFSFSKQSAQIYFLGNGKVKIKDIDDLPPGESYSGLASCSKGQIEESLKPLALAKADADFTNIIIKNTDYCRPYRTKGVKKVLFGKTDFEKMVQLLEKVLALKINVSSDTDP